MVPLEPISTVFLIVTEVPDFSSKSTTFKSHTCKTVKGGPYTRTTLPPFVGLDMFTGHEFPFTGPGPEREDLVDCSTGSRSQIGTYVSVEKNLV